MRAATSSSALVLTLALVGCHTTYVQKAESAYRAGRYLEAVEKLAAHEHEVGSLPAKNQARYGLVRGLALHEMGDDEGARRWLRYAYDVEAREPTLRPEERAELDAAWSQLEEGP